ncbi:HNH endonuclease signature motif containing protein [Kitasatospora sp. NPDC094028]
MTVNSDMDCLIPGCGKHAFGRGWCSMHYARWRTHGDPLHEGRRYVKQGETCAVEGCERAPKRRGMCEMHVRRLLKHGELTDPRERRFWAQVDTDGPLAEERPELGPCWVWTGCAHPKTGYGVFGGKGTQIAHRIAYQYKVGPIPKGLHLDHLCRRRLCVRPEHLEPVTPRENIRRGDQGAFWGYVPSIPERQPQVDKPTVCVEEGCERPPAKGSRCRPHYRKWLANPDRPARPTPEQRFWAKINKAESCWSWTAAVNPGTGYGHFTVSHGNQVQAHRYSYELAFGPIPEGRDVHHTCHVRHCVNPAHLEAVTRSENLRLRKVRR